jgi:enoyl-CoA hydratase/carnithine racemase
MAGHDRLLIGDSDLVVASPTAQFGLPEALRGIYAGAGGLPRLVRLAGMYVAGEVTLTGRRLSAQEAKSYLLINRISKTPESIVDEAVQLAQSIAAISPDAIIVTRAALRDAWETGSVERSFELIDDRFKAKLMAGENAAEGLKAFAEKRQPNWRPSKL